MSMEYYRGMLIQSPRMNAFREHLKNVVQPGDHVVEIGAGLGTYSFFAAEAGASRVTAIEGTSITAVAKTIARENGFSDRVEFIRGWYPRVKIPDSIDVVIFEDYPSRLFDAATFNLLRHIHEELLSPGTRLVPNRAKLFAAPVYSESNWRVVGGLGEGNDSAYGVDWNSSRQYICNTPLRMPLNGDDLRHEPKQLADIRLDVPPDADALAGSADWLFAADTTIHGLAYWFEFEVGDGVWLSNEPGKEPGSWGYLYLPIPEPLKIRAGERLTSSVSPEVRSDKTPGWLVWNLGCGGWSYSGHEFKSFAASLSDIVQSSPSWIPRLSDEAHIERKILESADGTRTVDDIAAAIRPMIPKLSDDEVRSYVLQILKGRTTGDLETRGDAERRR